MYKKEYHRYQEIRHFEKGENTTVIYLEKKTEIPSSSTMQGTVIKIILDKGTRSENIYYKIKTDAGDEEYIFDDIGMNQGFEEFVNKRVNVRGFIDNGFIGWQGEQVNGIYIESIEIV